MLVQDAVELSDEGARLLAEGCRPFRGPDGQHMTPGQCTVVNVDILARFWLVRGTLRDYNPNTERACVVLLELQRATAQLSVRLP